jgi:hypothetical protein
MTRQIKAIILSSILWVSWCLRALTRFSSVQDPDPTAPVGGTTGVKLTEFPETARQHGRRQRLSWPYFTTESILMLTLPFAPIDPDGF